MGVGEGGWDLLEGLSHPLWAPDSPFVLEGGGASQVAIQSILGEQT